MITPLSGATGNSTWPNNGMIVVPQRSGIPNLAVRWRWADPPIPSVINRRQLGSWFYSTAYNLLCLHYRGCLSGMTVAWLIETISQVGSSPPRLQGPEPTDLT